MRFHQKKYIDAVRLFKKVCQLDPRSERKELELSYLGRSYLALGRYNDALEYLSKAYESFRERSRHLQRDFERREYLEYLQAFSDILEKVGQSDRARAVSREAEEYASEISKKVTRPT